MDIELISEKKDGYVIKRTYSCPCGKGYVEEESVSLQSGKEGEVYRFILEEDRPDIIMYNDSLRVVLIFEAKDSLEKLLEKKQAEKSAAVVVKLANILHAKGTNDFWKGRENYNIILGLLWGSNYTPETNDKKENLYNYYHELVSSEASVYSDLVIGVETLYSGGTLRCTSFFKAYDDIVPTMGQEIVRSLVG